MIDVEAIHASKERDEHRASSIDLCVYSMLLCIVALVGWAVKKCRRLRNYVHESSLALIAGLITGGIIVLAVRNEAGPAIHTVEYKENLSQPTIPDELFLHITNSSDSIVYEYKYPLLTTEASNIARKTIFDPEVFFNLILPLLIFETGLRLEKINFFENIGKIIVLAFAGTMLATMITMAIMILAIKMFRVSFSIMNVILFSTIISATDPVTVLSIFKSKAVSPDLNALVTGESILNDAVCITVANVIEEYQISNLEVTNTLASLTGLLLEMVRVVSISVSSGVGMALLTSLILKFARIENSPLVENTVFILLSYCSFLVAEISQATGTVAVLFCGIAQSHYTENNMSSESVGMLHQFFKLFSFLAENFTFIYIGISLLTHQVNRWSPVFAISAIVAIVVARCISIYLLSAIINKATNYSVPRRWQHLLVFAGTRGAVAFALAIRGLSSEFRQIMLTTTSCIILITVLACGSLTSLVIETLDLEEGAGINDSLNIAADDLQTPDDVSMIIDVEDVRYCVQRRSWLIRFWQKFDVWYLTPIFTNKGPLLEHNLPRFLRLFGRMLTSKQQRLNALKIDESK